MELAAALKYRGYDFRFEYGMGGHIYIHGMSILPETLQWMWRDWRDRDQPTSSAGLLMAWFDYAKRKGGG